MKQRGGFLILKVVGVLSLFPLMLYSSNQANFSFNHISVEQRLPGESVHCVFQDHKGLMWLALESIGLCKYDGENFTVYERSLSDSNSISNNFPLCIDEDGNGNMWVGTTEGLNKFNRATGRWTRYLNSPESDNCIPNNYIKNLHVDCYDNVWIATRRGISKYIQGQNKFHNFLVGERLQNTGTPQMVSTFHEDAKGNMWIGSYSSGLFLIDAETNLKHTNNGDANALQIKHWYPIVSDIEATNYAIEQICEFDDSTLLLGKIDGLSLFNVNTEVFTKYSIRENSSINNAVVSSLIKDSSGMIWVGYATDGLVLIDPLTDKQNYFDANIYLHHGLRSNSIRDVYEDKSGLIWIATKFQGILTYDKRQETLSNPKYNTALPRKIRSSFILSLIEDSKKNIWIGTKYDGIYKFNPATGKIINYSSSEAQYFIGNNRVECMAEDVFGNVWAGTEKGLYSLGVDDVKFKRRSTYFTRCIFPDKKGNLWIGTNSTGVFYYNVDTKTIDRFKSASAWDLFKDNNFGIRGIFSTSDSLLWISTFQNGLFKYSIQKDQQIQYLHDPYDSTSISGNMVRGVFQDNAGKIWVGTKSNGLNIYDSETGGFSHLQKTNGLPPSTIYNIIQDKEDNYWMGSHEGLVFMDNRGENCSLYNSNYGLLSNILEVNAKCKTSDGLMIFGGSEGLNVFNPLEVQKKNFSAPLVISSVHVYDKLIAEDISEYAELSINYDEDYLSLDFALAEYSDPLRIQYKYKLKNFDKDWVLCGNRNYATYTSLPPGEYYFKVLAANPDMVWMTEPLTLKIIINSPFWRKPTFIIGILVFLMILTVLIYFWRLHFLRKNERRLLRLVDVKTHDLLELNHVLEENKIELQGAKNKAEESDRLKTAFLANMSHEIRTPMNGIIGFADLLKEPDLTSQEMVQYVDIIQKSSDRMLMIINDLIDISKIEAGQVTIIKDDVDVNALIDELAQFFTPLTETNGIELITKNDVSIDNAFIKADKVRLAQVLSNLIYNAIKFTPTGGITLGYVKKGALLEFFVQDTGIGISLEMQKTIFERFRKAEDKLVKNTDGSGLGLSISKAFVELHGGEIWIESEKGVGSTFYFTIPYS